MIYPHVVGVGAVTVEMQDKNQPYLKTKKRVESSSFPFSHTKIEREKKLEKNISGCWDCVGVVKAMTWSASHKKREKADKATR